MLNICVKNVYIQFKASSKNCVHLSTVWCYLISQTVSAWINYLFLLHTSSYFSAIFSPTKYGYFHLLKSYFSPLSTIPTINVTKL